jgi:Carboxypeptidase regulatory-like domain/TonB dependent receptor-like, beta-barrel
MKSISLAIVLALSSIAVWAQGTSQIQGVVKDTSGAVIGGAEVKATQTETGVARTVVSTEDGVYVFPNLAIGPYRLEASKPGFSTYVQSGIVLQVASSQTVDITLTVGEVAQQIQVEANTSLVELQTTSIGSVIENTRILELPLNGRNPVELIQLAGAAVPAGQAGTAGMPGGRFISIGGGLLSGVSYVLDGTLYNNPFDSLNLPFPFPDALQEFKVETSSLTAQNGLHSAGTVSAVVKSGTNAFHGDAFEFFRNGKMNARNANAARRDTLKRNQFGGTLGGPIIQNKLFFFAGYQGTRTRSDPADLTSFVPTSRMLSGDFSGCGFAQLRDASGAPYPNNQIPVADFSPQALEIVKKLPAAQGPCGDTKFGPVQKINEYQVLGRTDYQINDKQSLFVRYMATAYLLPPAVRFSQNILDTSVGGLDDLAQAATVGHTYLFSPNTINAFRIAANRVAVHRFNDDYFSGCDIGVQIYCFVPHQTVVTVTGGPTIGVGTAIEASFVPMYYTVSDDVNLVRGSHQFSFGYSGFKYQHSQKANVFSSIAFGFNGTASGAGMSDFLLGRLGTLTQGVPNTTFTYKWYHGLYAQDSWKVTPRLTLNGGLRWEPFLPQGFTNGAVFNFSWDRFNQGIHSTVFKNAPAGLLYAGDPGFTGKTGVENRYMQFAPRAGLAFDPKGDGKTSIRASFGMFYDFPNIMIASTPTTAPPFGNTVQPPGPLNFADPFSTVPGGNPFPGTFGPDAPFVQSGSFMAMEPNAKGTTVYSWNLSIQRQFGHEWLFSTTYMGNETAHLWGTQQLNPAVIVPCPGGATLTTCNTTNNTNERRLASLLNPQEGKYLGYVDQFTSGGTASYNALLLSTQKRMSHGVSFNANYTWSHCISDIYAGSNVGGVGAGYLDPNNRHFDRANCQTPTLDPNSANSLDRRHIANISAVLASPNFAGRTLNMLASNWRLSTSYRVLSGAFMTATTGVDRQLSGAGNGTQRADRLLPDPLCAHPNPGCWFNPAAFTQPAPGTLGNAGRATLPGPGFWGIDAALSRIFRLQENMSVEARVEAFNLTNSYRAGIPITAINNQNFGKILTAQDPRIMQLALKLVF